MQIPVAVRAFHWHPVRSALAAVRRPEHRIAPIDRAWACRHERWTNSGANDRMIPAKGGRRGWHEASLGRDTPNLPSRLLRHLTKPASELAKVELERSPPKWTPVLRESARGNKGLEHDAGQWNPVSRNHHAITRTWSVLLFPCKRSTALSHPQLNKYRDLTMKLSMIATMLFGCALLASWGDGSDAATTPAPAPSSGPAPTPTPTSDGVRHILFVGDSLTHGRYTPVRSYNARGSETDTTGSAYVTDENYNQSGDRKEREPGPWGGIPGIFAELAVEAGLQYDVHIEAISATSLAKNYQAAHSVIDQSIWNAVVLQEISTLPLPPSLTGDPSGDPAKFCSSVQTIEAGIHSVAPTADVYLYETWPDADTARRLSLPPSEHNKACDFSCRYTHKLEKIRAAYHASYYDAALKDGKIAGVAPAGDAWAAAWTAGVANPNPYSGNTSLPSLWYGINATNDPSITSPDYLHPSVHGAYLSGLVLFEHITGVDVTTLGMGERAASQLGISASTAVALQKVAHDAVGNGRTASKIPRNGGC